MTSTDSFRAPICVSTLIDASELKLFHLQVVFLCGCLIFLDGFDLQAVSYAAPSLAASLGIPRAVLGLVFSAGLCGLSAGSLVFGVLGDRFGRKSMFVLCSVLFGTGSFFTAHASSLNVLLAWRIVAGLGLGGATPIALTIASDYCPKRVRSALAILMYSSFAIGGLAAGGAASLLSSSRWRTVFHVGGILPILCAPVLLRWLPESLEYLVVRRKRLDEVVCTLRKLDPNFEGSTENAYTVANHRAPGFSVAQLFRNGRSRRTILLWTVFFTSLVAIYFYNTWVPTLLTDSGYRLGLVVVVTAAGQIGGLVGALVLAKLTLKNATFLVIAAGYLCGAAAFAGMSFAETWFPVLLISNACIGFFFIGAQYGLNAVSAQLYPPGIRSTGIGWAIGLGRLGGISGPGIAGLLVALRWSPSRLFLFAAIPALVAALMAYRIARELGFRRESGITPS